MSSSMVFLLFAAMVRLPVMLSARADSASGAGAYAEFREKYRRSGDDSLSYHERFALFEKKLATIEAHNAQPDKAWVAGLNKFADYTKDEFEALLGHRLTPRGSSQISSLLETRPSEMKALAATVDWRQTLNSSGVDFVKDQGSCGSCWAVAAASALETHAEFNGKTHRLSYEQLVDCVPNPEECGGQGGCKGATSELAFKYVQEHGLARAEDYHGYQTGAGEGKCKRTSTAARSKGFERLPENKLRPMMEALSTKGPMVVSVDAGGWSSYQSGVFNSCPRDATVNHAVMLLGYGTDKKLGKDYWLIRNSWGADWGENSMIRLQRHSSDVGHAGYCGTDKKPQDGVGCKGGPSKIPVCGMCGVLSDSSYPIGVKIIETSAMNKAAAKVSNAINTAINKIKMPFQ